MALPRTSLVKSESPNAFAAFAGQPAPSAIGEATWRQNAMANARDAAVPEPQPEPPAHAMDVTARELLERAAARGPARLTWESIVLPADPILDEKRRPHVTERRRRFTRMVKVGLGACVVMCVAAFGITALSGDASSKASAASSDVTSDTIPSKAVVPVETLGGARYAKAVRPAATTAANVRPRRR